MFSLRVNSSKNNMRNFLLILFAILLQEAYSQNFTFQMISDTVKFGQPAGMDIVVSSNIINTNTTAIQIRVVRKQNNLPAGWDSYLCADICMAPFADSCEFYVNPSSSQELKVSFITTNVLDTANCLIVIKNLTAPGNTVTKRMWGITSTTAGMEENGTSAAGPRIFPNPCMDEVLILNPDHGKIKCFDAKGKEIPLNSENNSGKTKVNVSNLESGVFYLEIPKSGSTVIEKLIRN